MGDTFFVLVLVVPTGFIGWGERNRGLDPSTKMVKKKKGKLKRMCFKIIKEGKQTRQGPNRVG